MKKYQTKLLRKEVRSYGVDANHGKMLNGELRFRFSFRDGTGFIRTHAGKKGGWQKSHQHLRVTETHVIQRGRGILVELKRGALHYKLVGPGEVITAKSKIPHTMYLAPNTVILSVKYGTKTNAVDWVACPDLDQLIKGISPRQAFQLAK